MSVYNNLFESESMNNTPLAERMRPPFIDDVQGQEHLLGPGKPLRVAFESGKLHSMILWGPPGVGKTTLARLMADSFNAEFIPLSAVLSGVKEIREAVERARVIKANSGRSTILFVDEVHRFNKSQQDAFLPHVESGLITFIGATTENPSFEVNNALLSRAAVYVLNALSEDDLAVMLERARLEEFESLVITEEAQSLLVQSADGDGRRLLNNFELATRAALDKKQTVIDSDLLVECLGSRVRRFDDGGENFYDVISAFHKSIRGSNPDAALYWLVRMLDGGADPRYITRRMIVIASEDIGLADPRALRIALDAAEAYERVGSPEGEYALAEAAVYLACTSKSNAVYSAFHKVRELVSKDSSRPVPLHLRNAPTQLMKDLGFKKGYRYAHDEPDAYAAGEVYLPEGLVGQHWYEPTSRGLEDNITEKLNYLRQLDSAAQGKV